MADQKQEPTEGVDGIAADIIRKLAEASVEPQIEYVVTEGLSEESAYPSQVPIFFDPTTKKPISLKQFFDEYRNSPERVEGTATVDTLISFIALLDRHKTENSAIFGKTTWPTPALTAVIDYHGNHTPAFLKHRIVYPFPITEELKAWIKQNNINMEQKDFAAFLEEHAAELTVASTDEAAEYEPLFKTRFGTPAELIALSRDLEIHVNQQIKRQERLQTGERVIYFKEEHMTGDGVAVDVPGVFMVSVPAFLGGDKVRMPARLRYRTSGNNVIWFYQLYRWEWWLRDHVYHDMTKAATSTKLPAYEGSPEK